MLEQCRQSSIGQLRQTWRSLSSPPYHSALSNQSVNMVLLSLAVVMIEVRGSAAQSDLPSGRALLRGVEQSRAALDGMDVELEFVVNLPAPAKKTQVLVEQSGEMRRCERRGDPTSHDSVVTIDNDVVHAYDRIKNNSVRLCDISYAANTAGDMAFDPRVLGLADMPTVNTTLDACLKVGDPTNVKVDGPETVNGVETWRVVVDNGGSSSTYWIEEPSFRVHRRKLKWPSGQSLIESSFDSVDPKIPIPSHVTVKRLDGTVATDLVYRIAKFEVNKSIAGERFTLASMDLPVNTMVIDYRTQRVTGYWDGKKLSVNPVSAPDAD